MRITFVTRKFGNVERNSHCDVLHTTPVRVASLFLDCNGVFAIKAYTDHLRRGQDHGDNISRVKKIKSTGAIDFELGARTDIHPYQNT